MENEPHEPLIDMAWKVAELVIGNKTRFHKHARSFYKDYKAAEKGENENRHQAVKLEGEVHDLISKIARRQRRRSVLLQECKSLKKKEDKEGKLQSLKEQSETLRKEITTLISKKGKVKADLERMGSETNEPSRCPLDLLGLPAGYETYRDILDHLFRGWHGPVPPEAQALQAQYVLLIVLHDKELQGGATVPISHGIWSLDEEWAVTLWQSMRDKWHWWNKVIDRALRWVKADLESGPQPNGGKRKPVKAATEAVLAEHPELSSPKKALPLVNEKLGSWDCDGTTRAYLKKSRVWKDHMGTQKNRNKRRIS